MAGDIGKILFVCSIIFGCVAADDILRLLFLKNNHAPLFHERHVHEIGFANNLTGAVNRFAQGMTEGPITSFLMFIQPSQFATLRNDIDSQYTVQNHLFERFGTYWTDRGFQAPSVLFLIASYDGADANHAAEISRMICACIFNLRRGAVSLLLTGSATNGVSNELLDQYIRGEFENIMATISESETASST